MCVFFFFKQKTAYEMRISDWSSDVCSSDLPGVCDVCGSAEFKRRPDDNEETVRTRMAEYRAKTAPILPYYEARGLVARVDGMADIGDVNRSIDRILDSGGRSALQGGWRCITTPFRLTVRGGARSLTDVFV